LFFTKPPREAQAAGTTTNVRKAEPNAAHETKKEEPGKPDNPTKQNFNYADIPAGIPHNS
jgi:hypothetical protein